MPVLNIKYLGLLRIKLSFLAVKEHCNYTESQGWKFIMGRYCQFLCYIPLLKPYPVFSSSCIPSSSVISCLGSLIPKGVFILISFFWALEECHHFRVTTFPQARIDPFKDKRGKGREKEGKGGEEKKGVRREQRGEELLLEFESVRFWTWERSREGTKKRERVDVVL